MGLYVFPVLSLTSQLCFLGLHLHDLALAWLLKSSVRKQGLRKKPWHSWEREEGWRVIFQEKSCREHSGPTLPQFVLCPEFQGNWTTRADRRSGKTAMRCSPRSSSAPGTASRTWTSCLTSK